MKFSSAVLGALLASLAQCKTRFGGVNLAGFDFGMVTTVSFIRGLQRYGLAVELSLGNARSATDSGTRQIQHFVNDDKHNLFRLPFGWQFLTANNLGGTLNSNNLARYDSLVQACLSSGAYCILDLHNYARWNGGIVGQGGPTDAQLASIWSQLAKKYASQSRVIFGIMNEPHDLPSVTTWAKSVQASVTAIRNAGATSQMILLPGTDWTSAANFVSSGSLAALQTVKNLDGSATNLIFDVHKYLDYDNSGTHVECSTNNVQVFTDLAAALRKVGRQAMLTETGGGNVQSCVQAMCQQLDTINSNSDVYLGYTGWSAGAFQPSWNYILSLVPTRNGNSWTNTLLAQSCFRR